MNERKQCRKKEMELKDNIDILQEEIDGKKKELEETLHQFNNRKSNTATLFDLLSSKADSLHEDLRKLDKRMQNLRKNVGRIKEGRMQFHKDIYTCKKVQEKSLKETQRVYDVIEREVRNVKRLGGKDYNLAARIKAAQRVRQLKLHPLTVKKIFLGGYVPGDMNGVSGKCVILLCMGVVHNYTSKIVFGNVK